MMSCITNATCNFTCMLLYTFIAYKTLIHSRMANGYITVNIWSYRLDMGCHTMSPVPVWVRIPSPQTRVRGVAEYPGGGIPGSVRCWGRWHCFGKTYLTCIIAQVLENYSDTLYWHFVSTEGSVSCSWKWKPVIRSPGHNPLLLQLSILLHSMALADIQRI